MEAIIGFLFFAFIISAITSNAAPALKQKGDDKKIDYASEIKKLKEREIALAKQRAWKQKGGKL
jgi:hypothetical protein